jgi:hypothetical protein
MCPPKVNTKPYCPVDGGGELVRCSVSPATNNNDLTLNNFITLRPYRIGPPHRRPMMIISERSFWEVRRAGHERSHFQSNNSNNDNHIDSQPQPGLRFTQHHQSLCNRAARSRNAAVVATARASNSRGRPAGRSFPLLVADGD